MMPRQPHGAEYTVLPKEICDMVFITVSTGVGGEL